MKAIFILLLLFTLISCNNLPSVTNTQSGDNADEHNTIVSSIETGQNKDTISGSGDMAIPLKLIKGVLIVDFSITDNYDESFGQKSETNYSVMLKSVRGIDLADNIAGIMGEYNGSISITIPFDGDYVANVQSSPKSKWILKIK